MDAQNPLSLLLKYSLRGGIKWQKRKSTELSSENNISDMMFSSTLGKTIENARTRFITN